MFGIGIKYSTYVDALVICKLASSKSDANRLIKQGGISVNDEKLIENRNISTDDMLYGKFIILRKGKKYVQMMSFNDLDKELS